MGLNLDNMTPEELRDLRAQLLEMREGTARQLRFAQARDDLITFTEVTMPHPKAPDDPHVSMFEAAPHLRKLADLLMKAERGEELRTIITLPPRHGKSELASRRFAPWFMARDPYRQVIFSTYSDTFAQDFGRAWRDIMTDERFREVFPEVALKKRSQASDRLETTAGGLMVAVGAGGAVTGRGADLLLIDDPFKNHEEADSPAVRDQRWNWFTSTAFTRLMPGGRIVIILTRWHEDDIVGRIDNPDYVDPEEAAKYTRLDIKAIENENTDHEQALWPERYPLPVLHSIRRTIGPRNWSALYQQRPTPEQGTYFTRDMIVGYQPHELPRNLRKYAASDHAVTEKQERDATVLGCVGIDNDDTIWVLPDLVWDRMETDRTVEEMISLMRMHRPMLWWAENDIIRKAIGPFLRRRMREEQVYTMIDPQTPSRDKKARARSIQGRMAMKRVRFPTFAPWWPAAQQELMSFGGGGKHDDFVDWLSWIGLGLDIEIGASVPAEPDDKVIEIGSPAWVKAQTRAESRERERLKAVQGF